MSKFLAKILRWFGIRPRVRFCADYCGTECSGPDWLSEPIGPNRPGPCIRAAENTGLKCHICGVRMCLQQYLHNYLGGCSVLCKACQERLSKGA